MPTIINNPVPVERSNSGSGFLMGVILLVVVGLFLLVYGIPYVARYFSTGGAQINVPSNINVHYNK